MADKRQKSAIGNIRKLPSGRYQLRYTDPNGNPKTGGTFSDRTAAQKQMNRIQRSIEDGTWFQKQGIEAGDINPKTLTLIELGAYWRAQRRNKRGQPLSPNTLAEYERLTDVVLAGLNQKPIRDITTGQIVKWWEPESRRAPRQANAAYKHLKTLMSFAVKQHWLPVSPCTIEGAEVYVSDNQPVIPTCDQVETMESEAVEPLGTIIALAAWGGLRKGEIYELRRQDIEQVEDAEGVKWHIAKISRSVIWNEGKPSVKTPKTPGSIRQVMLPQRVSDGLTRHLSTIPINPDALLFSANTKTNEHLTEHALERAWRRVKALADYPGSFHSLRAFAATQYGLQGATVAELMDRLGHRDIRTAMRYQRTTGRETELLRKLG